MLVAFVHTMDIDISTAKLAAEKAALLEFPTNPKAKQLVELADKIDECRAKDKELDAAMNVHVVPGEHRPFEPLSPAHKLLRSHLSHTYASRYV